MATTLVISGDQSRRPKSEQRLARAPRGEASGSNASVRLVAAAGGVTLLMIAGAVWKASPLDAIDHGTIGGSAGSVLHLPGVYTVLSPLCEAYDALTLLALRQHAALLGWLLAGFAIIRSVRWARRRGATIGVYAGWRALQREAMLLGGVVLSFIAVYVAGAIVPRPMAALALDDRDELAVDVHSHTSVSHDGRPGFDAEANRRWHAAAGFAAAYITDHRYYDGAVAGALGNPRTAGEGTVLLPGIESAAPHSRVTILGARRAMNLDEDGRLDVARLAGAPGVVIVLTTPAALTRVPSTLPLNAVEVSDGAPRGLMFTRRLAPAIARFADSRGLVEVAGSNNHGWGRTATAWTVLRIPGWRALSPDSLDRAIRSTLLDRPGAVRVVARGSVAAPRSMAELLATPALVIWSIVTRLSTLERASWLAWAWAATALALFMRRRRIATESDDDVLPFTTSLPNADPRRGAARRRGGRRAAR